jgi:hypothetical protein
MAGSQAGLIVAEVELTSEDQAFEMPWLIIMLPRWDYDEINEAQDESKRDEDEECRPFTRNLVPHFDSLSYDFKENPGGHISSC